MPGTLPRAATLLAWLALGAAACAPPAWERYGERIEKAPQAAEHAVHSERLREVMQRLGRLSAERLPRAFDVETARRAQLEEVAVVARAIADSAQRIADVADAIALGPLERSEFLALADTLARRAGKLAERALGLGPAALRDELAALDATCAQCHQRFRIAR